MLLMYISTNHTYVKTSSWSSCKFLPTLCSGLVRVQMRYWLKLLNWSPRKQQETSRLPIKNMFFFTTNMVGNRPEVSFKSNGWIGRIHREVSLKMGSFDIYKHWNTVKLPPLSLTPPSPPPTNVKFSSYSCKHYVEMSILCEWCVKIWTYLFFFSEHWLPTLPPGDWAELRPRQQSRLEFATTCSGSVSAYYSNAYIFTCICIKYACVKETNVCVLWLNTWDCRKAYFPCHC